MRLLVIGLVLLGLSISISEYVTRSRSSSVEKATKLDPKIEPRAEPKPKEEKISDELAMLLATSQSADVPIQKPKELLSALLKTDASAPATLKALVSGVFASRNLVGGFGWSVFLADLSSGETGIIRVAEGEKPQVILVWPSRIDALLVDGSTLFFSSGDTIYSKPARGEESVSVVVRFSNSRVVHFSVTGAGVVVAIQAKNQPSQTHLVRVDAQQNVSVLAANQSEIESMVSDNKEVFWITKRELFHAPVDGVERSRLSENVSGQLLLESKFIIVNTTSGLSRLARDSGEPQLLLKNQPKIFSSIGGLIRFADGTKLLESTGTTLASFESSITGLAMGGTSLFVLTSDENSSSVFVK